MYCNILNKAFEDQFYISLSSIRGRKKNIPMKYAGALYRRWYYSALIEDTFLTPANLNDAAQNSGDIIIPSLRRGNESLCFKDTNYSLDNHPVIDDLIQLIEFCKPDIDLDVDLAPDGKSAEGLARRLSIYDPFYVEYLTIVAITSNLLVPFPAIHTTRMQVSKSYDEFIDRPRREIFAEIFHASVVSSSTMLRENIFPFGEFFTIDNIQRLLTDPLSTDELFSGIYGSMDVGLDLFLELPDVDSDVLMNSMALGFLYDKFFLTVFGYYLKLIYPFYTLPFEFTREISYLTELRQDDPDLLISALYMPSSHYRLTRLGSEFLELPTPDPELAESGRSIDELTEMILAAASDPAVYNHLLNKFHIGGESGKVIYELKVKALKRKEIWFNLEIPASASLYQLFDEISYYYNLDPMADFSFYTDKSENPFTEYSNKGNARPGKSPDIALEQLFCDEKQIILLTVHDHKLKFVLELLSTKERAPKQTYPRVSRLSKYFKNQEML